MVAPERVATLRLRDGAEPAAAAADAPSAHAGRPRIFPRGRRAEPFAASSLGVPAGYLRRVRRVHRGAPLPSDARRRGRAGGAARRRLRAVADPSRRVPERLPRVLRVRATRGHGSMRGAMPLVFEHAFGQLGLHRLQANVQPGNVRSLRLLAATGWREEGFAPRYLHIDGGWRDHVMFAITAEDVRGLSPRTAPDLRSTARRIETSGRCRAAGRVTTIRQEGQDRAPGRGEHRDGAGRQARRERRPVPARRAARPGHRARRARRGTRPVPA